MIVSVHQPHFLPWLGYFNKIFNSDVFVWLHTVQYRKNYFQSRTRIKNPQGETAFWLTIPVHATLETTIDRVTIADKKWNVKIIKTIEQFYRKTSYFEEVWKPLKRELEKPAELLDDINFRTSCLLLDMMGYAGKIYRMSELGIDCDDPNERLRAICNKFEANDYIAGKGGRNYMNEEEWLRAGITIHWQHFDSMKVHYSQIGNSFVNGLSIIDCLFNVGIVQTKEIVISAWKVSP